ncbi:MAG TPA: ABC transporter ATP-binding protein [Gaiellaceae bacterium]|nr:ABC transporter ATP-binding protein [Gaiellaceae bacterium]
MASVTFLNVNKRFGEDVVAVDDFTLTVEDGEFLILVGPSGCGKTTLLRMVAGLEDVTSGEIRIGNKLVNDLPPTERDVAMVFQNYALYPHMTVYENLAFPLRQKKVRRDKARHRVIHVAELLGIGELLERKPRALSGGQRQRVAIGRALVREPQTFLMDEPLSNLDAKLRVRMRAELISLHKRLGITTIYVTHDQTEAMTLGDRVVVLRAGIVQQIDTPERLYRQPSNTFVAGFIGSPAMNFLSGSLEQGTVDLGGARVALPDRLKQRLERPSGEVIVGVRPEDFFLAPNGPAASPFSAEIEITEELGPETQAHVRAEGLRIAHLGERSAESDDEQKSELSDTLVVRFDSNTDMSVGERVQLTVNAERVQLFDPGSGDSLLSSA